MQIEYIFDTRHMLLLLLLGGDGIDHINHNPEPATTKMRGGLGHMYPSVGHAAGGVVPSTVPDSTRDRRGKGKCVRIRDGPI